MLVGAALTLGARPAAGQTGPPGGAAGLARAAATADVRDVALVLPPAGDQVLSQAMARIRLELNAAHLQTHPVDCSDAGALETEACVAARVRTAGVEPLPNSAAADSSGDDGLGPPAGVEPALPSPGAGVTAAVLSLSRRGRAVVVDAVAILPSGTKIFRLVHLPAAPAAGDPAMLALRAVELLRDVRLEAVRSASEEEAQRQRLQAEVAVPPLSAPVVAPPPPAEPDPALLATARGGDAPARGAAGVRWSAGAGAMVLQGSRGFGSAWGPSAHVVATVRRHLGVTAMLAGPFFSHLPAPRYGALDVRQELAAVGGHWAFDGRLVRPFASAMVGVHHLRLAGAPDPALTPGRPYGQGAWSLMVSAMAGLLVPIWRDVVAVAAEAGALGTAPPTDVGVGAEVLGRVGGPSFLYRLSVVAQLP